MIEITCRHCGTKEMVTGLLAAAQQPCAACGKPLMGEQTAREFSAPPPSLNDLPPAPGSTPGAPAGKLDFNGLMLGAVIGALVPAGVAMFGDGLDLALRGIILGALTGVVFTPFIALGMFFTAIRTRHSMFVGLSEMASKGVIDGLANAVIERRFGKALFFLGIFVFIGMGCGGLLGSGVHEIKMPLLVLAMLGGACLGGGIGFALAPTKTEEEPKADEEQKAEEKKVQEEKKAE
jgi:hypothetical protein